MRICDAPRKTSTGSIEQPIKAHQVQLSSDRYARNKDLLWFCGGLIFTHDTATLPLPTVDPQLPHRRYREGSSSKGAVLNQPKGAQAGLKESGGVHIKKKSRRTAAAAANAQEYIGRDGAPGQEARHGGGGTAPEAIAECGHLREWNPGATCGRKHAQRRR